MMSQEKKAILEALVFASDTPLTPERAAEVLTDTDKKEIGALLEEMARDYATRSGGVILAQVAGGFQFRTKPEMASWIRKLRAARPAMLSPAALETLAVIAYRQPIVKADIDRIRGVDVSGALKGLLEKKIVRIVGRKDVPGKPIIYGTTKRFLEIFNLKALSELPTLRDMKDLQIESGTETLELPGFREGADRLDDGNATAPSATADPQAGQDLQDDARGPVLEAARDLPADTGAVPALPESTDSPEGGSEQIAGEVKDDPGESDVPALPQLQEEGDAPILEVTKDLQGDSAEPALPDVKALQENRSVPILEEPKDLQCDDGEPTLQSKDVPGDGSERQE